MDEIWKAGRQGTVVTDSVEGFLKASGHLNEGYYGGKALICESVWRPKDAQLISAAPDMLRLLGKFADLIDGPWDDPVISKEVYDELHWVLEKAIVVVPNEQFKNI